MSTIVLADVNVLVAAYRDDAPSHLQCRAWLERVLEADEAFGMSTLVLSGFLRIVTHPRVFAVPSALEHAKRFVRSISKQPHCVWVSPGSRHWGIFLKLCADAKARGNLIPDAYLAALAIESGCDWITLDRDFARFDGLRWRPPA